MASEWTEILESGRFPSAASINFIGRTFLIGSCGFNRVDDICPGVGQMEKQTLPSFAPKKRHVTAFKLFGTNEIGPYVNSWARTVHLGSCAIPSRNAGDVSVSCVRKLGISEEWSRERSLVGRYSLKFERRTAGKSGPSRRKCLFLNFVLWNLLSGSTTYVSHFFSFSWCQLMALGKSFQYFPRR